MISAIKSFSNASRGLFCHDIILCHVDSSRCRHSKGLTIVKSYNLFVESSYLLLQVPNAKIKRWTHPTPTPQIFQVYSSLFSWINVCASKWLQQNDFCVSSEQRNLLNWLLNDEIYRRFLLLKPFVCIMLVKCWEQIWTHWSMSHSIH